VSLPTQKCAGSLTLARRVGPDPPRRSPPSPTYVMHAPNVNLCINKVIIIIIIIKNLELFFFKNQ
ncbi:MAG: hypothetical protein AAGK05_10600, partial [Pseudomonadota bacterium]